ncbi:pentatricopeptide repeat-containing protein [Pyrus ussuriensis x Pyrus communis]|uniref:Pentatricopeptide repeat-containing protein n=1 Tax=Pyrus ussuriensis x Pyrus communis TaxID=2448454 RepID=A0A5N5GQZ7_9ROSA|nr:pentatricopeptide repeat-containing protein [Pyrus ussuriensis x Pyrus communis]
MLDEFPKQKCELNTLTFSTIMHGLCVNGKVDEAFGLLKRMENEGIVPDTIMFNILIAGLGKRGLIRRFYIVFSKGVGPSFASYKALIHGLCKENLVQDVDWGLEQMICDKVFFRRWGCGGRFSKACLQRRAAIAVYHVRKL